MNVTDVSPTPQSLLGRLRVPGDRAAWTEFVDLYSGLILLWARRLGAPAGDAEDVTQDVFLVLSKELPAFRYDPSRRFRGYLFRITRNCAVDAARRRCAGTGTTVSLPADLPGSDDDADRVVEAEYCAHVTRRAVELLKGEFEPQTWQAFWLYAVEASPAEQVAATLGVSAASVYQAKTRVLRRLRQELDGLLE